MFVSEDKGFKSIDKKLTVLQAVHKLLVYPLEETYLDINCNGFIFTNNGNGVLAFSGVQNS